METLRDVLGKLSYSMISHLTDSFPSPKPFDSLLPGDKVLKFGTMKLDSSGYFSHWVRLFWGENFLSKSEIHPP